MNNSQTNDSNPCYSGQWSRTCMLQEQQCASLPGLNPCCSGQWSRTQLAMVQALMSIRLNPCCSGQWSRTITL